MKVLLLNQCFWPDMVATAQQSTGVARALVERGHEVTVISSRRGYDDVELRFPRRERWQGIEIIRVPSISLGKTSRWRRALNFASFSVAAALRLLVTRPQDTVIALTSPPLISWLASVFIRMKGGRMVFWVMDLNPDEAIAAGWLKSDSVVAKLLSGVLRSSMLHAEKIIVLDRFAKQRIVDKGIRAAKIEIIPPWSHDDAVSFDREGREAFRRRHELSEKFVVMYAGNHSPCHPLDTLLEAAEKLKQSDDIAFVFVGGGSEFSKVKEFARRRQLENIRCLPYQPQAELSAVLSAADLHVVIMGEGYQGIVHPCKIYNILAVGLPFLYVGPAESHVSEIITRLPRGAAFSAQHGQVDTVAQAILQRAESWRAGRGEVEGHGLFSTAPPALAHEFSSRTLLPRLIAQIESTPPGRTDVAQTSVCDPKPEPQTKVCAANQQ